MEKTLAHNYAQILLHFGVNLQKGQPVFISAPVEAAEFTEILVTEAYQHGASDVEISWNSAFCSAERLLYANEKSLLHIRPSLIAKYQELIEENRAIISLVSCQTAFFKDVSPSRIASFQKARQQALSFFSRAIMNSDLQWLVASVATPSWAQMLYPNLPIEDALSHLWEEIFSISRVASVDPILHWQSHLDQLHQVRRKLATLNLTALDYHSSNGTNLHIGLPPTHVWQGGNEKSGRVVPFAANIPTEEVFTAPHYLLTEGVVCASRPLVAYGQIINDIQLEFKAGKVVSFDASSGKETLEKILNTDEGASYLGEVAFVPKDSPISEKAYSFFETLIDENASCHLALGAAYPNCITNGKTMNDAQLRAHGLNRSDVHIDFMIGTDDLDIVGTTKAGTKISVFKNGTWSKDILI